MSEELWDAYLTTARERYEEIDRVERYKIELGRVLTKAREALLRDEREWPSLVTAAIRHKSNNIVNWRNHAKLVEWIDGNMGEARRALSEMWSEDDRTPGDRVRSFDVRLPESVLTRIREYSPRCRIVFHDGDRPATISAIPTRPVPSRVSEVGLSAVFCRRCRG